MERDTFLKLMRFPPEWREWDMLPDNLDECIARYEPGHEEGAEHDRHSAFQWWLRQSSPAGVLVKLAQLSWLDPDQPMAGFVRECIARQAAFDQTVANAIGTIYHRD